MWNLFTKFRSWCGGPLLFSAKLKLSHPPNLQNLLLHFSRCHSLFLFSFFFFFYLNILLLLKQQKIIWTCFCYLIRFSCMTRSALDKLDYRELVFGSLGSRKRWEVKHLILKISGAGTKGNGGCFCTSIHYLNCLWTQPLTYVV